MEENKKEFDGFIKELSESMNTEGEHEIFSYKPDDIKGLYDYVIKEKDKAGENHVFLSKFDIKQLVEMLFHSSSKQIDDFREILFAVYRYASKSEFIEADIIALRELLSLVQERMDADDDVMDKIQEKQLQWLCDNLKMFISQMS